MDDAVESVDVLTDLVGQPGEVLLVGDVELQHRRLDCGSRLAIRLVMFRARPKLEMSTVAPCSWATLAVANPMEESIVTPATRMRLPAENSSGCRHCVSAPFRVRRQPG